MLIREAEIKDAHALSELSAQLGYPAEPADIALRLEKLRRNPENHVFVAETTFAPNAERLVAGFISFESYETIYCAAGINITGFAVDEKLRRTGIGRKLMSAVEHFAEQNGFAFIRAESGAMRKEAHATVLQDASGQAQTALEVVLQCARHGNAKGFATKAGIKALAEVSKESPANRASVIDQCFMVPFVPVTE